MKLHHWALRLVLCLGGLATVTACAEAVAPSCECGSTDDGACVPCPEGREIDLPEGDLGVPFLNQEQIDENERFYLNQDGRGQVTIYTGEQSEVGIRVITSFGNPAEGITVNFELQEPNPNSPSGVRLQARSARSNEYGVAKITLQAGPDPAFVRLNMSAPNVAGLGYDINVVDRPSLDAPNNMGPNPNPNPNMLRCLKTKGTYNIVNRYQPASILGDDFNRALQRIHTLITDPGRFVGDLVADNIGGIVGNVAGAAVRYAVNYVFQYVVQNELPDWARQTLGVTTDVTTTLTDLEIRGTMQLGDEDPMACTVQGIHRWETLVFIWRNACDPNDQQCGRIEIPMNELGLSASETEFSASIEDGPFTDTMRIDEHQLQMNLGVAVIWFLERTVLPNFFNGMNSFGDLLARVIPCNAVGRIAANNLPDIPFVDEADIVADACRAGLRAAGQVLARELGEALNIDTFRMSGECQLRDQDNNNTVDVLEDGIWTGELDGTFTGERR